MKLSEFKRYLDEVPSLHFVLPDGTAVPQHFHITEAGITTKQFVDCGGTVRSEKNISFQLWVASDYEHRLEAAKLQKIIGIYEGLFGTDDLDVEIEYQGETIGRYGLAFNGGNFLLTTKQTDCLAKDNCGVPEPKKKLRLSELAVTETSCCTPGGGCC